MLKSKLLTGTVAGFLLLTSGPVFSNDHAGQADVDQFAFSVENMDRSVDPADDFLRYAAGGWMARVERPEDKASLTFLELMSDNVSDLLKTVVVDAGAKADEAVAGSPARQVGMLYNAYTDVEAINATGIEPLRPELDRLYAIKNKDELGSYLGHYTKITGTWPIFGIDVFNDLSNADRNAVYVAGGERLIPIRAIYLAEEGSPLREAYKKYVTDVLVIANYDETRAREIAGTALAIDTMLLKGEMDPVLRVDTRNLNNPRTFDELQAQAPGFDFSAFFAGLGFTRPDNVILMDTGYPAVAVQMMDRFTLRQLQDYLALRMIASFSSVLSTDFDEPRLEITRALFGAAPEETREERAVTFLQNNIGQPLGNLYVDTYFSREEQKTGLDMIRRIQSAFRKRVEANEWLSESTREAALEKVDKLYYRLGYPDRWIDYSSVEITDDLPESLMNIHRFEMERMASMQGAASEHWDFADSQHTYPTIINAAYNPTYNGFEVTAAIAQPPAFQVDMDAPVYFCRLGAAIAHEITHGFDSSGRNFDANGTMRNWWTAAETEYFDREARKLVAQGDRYEALPGKFMSGGLTVGENLADIGGIKVAHDALMQYLAEHPEENVEIDGLSPSQRCFISWAQLWVEKRSDQSMSNQLEDNHAPGNYRALAPLQQEPAFYEAFGIEEGDPMWVAPEDRINIW